MNSTRHTSLLLAVSWACAVALPVQSADAHGNNPRWEFDDLLPQEPKPPETSPGPKPFSMLGMDHLQLVNQHNTRNSGIPNLRTEDEFAIIPPIQLDGLPDPLAGLRSLLQFGGQSPYAFSYAPGRVSLPADQGALAEQASSFSFAGAVPAPGALALLGLAATIAGRRRRRHG